MSSEEDIDKKPISDKTQANSRDINRKGGKGATDMSPDVSETPSAADPVNAPTSKTSKGSDMEGLDKVHIEGEKTMTEIGSSIDKSSGDESGFIQKTVKNQVEQVSKKVSELLSYYRALDDVGKQLLTSSLIMGLLVGGAVPFLYYINVNSKNMERMGELQGVIEEKKAEKMLLKMAVDNCTEESRELEEDVDELGSLLDVRESDISVLQGKLSELYSYNQVYIKEATINYVDELIHLTISNPTDFNNVATRLTVISGLTSYTDESEDATGYLYRDSETMLTWDMEKAHAPQGFIMYDEVYLVMMTTLNNYTCLHQILPVDVTIRVEEWEYNKDRVFLETEWEFSVYPNISSIGLRKVGSEDERYYNASDGLIDEWYKGGLYNWNESAASAPVGFLSEGSAYLVRISFANPSEHLQWKNVVRYSYAREYTKARIDTKKDSSSQTWEK